MHRKKCFAADLQLACPKTTVPLGYYAGFHPEELRKTTKMKMKTTQTRYKSAYTVC
jgi:hypothetical protein